MSTVQFHCRLSETTGALPHFWEHTIGSGHAPLALRADWQEQLRRCHEELGFRHVRFHGLLCDDMGTLVDERGQLLYCFFNADQIWDFLLSIGMKPFVELSFMPTALASGDTTVFHYRANVTPPKDYQQWATLIHKLVTHWVQRYGVEEVRTWFFEVWNEPNLETFWPSTQADYFKLYRRTVQAIKEVDDRLQVGGPATAKDEWIEEFLDFCAESHLPADFVSTHHYPTDALGTEGADTLSQLAHSRRSMLREWTQDTHRRARGRPLYYTEWNISSNPRDLLHDEPYAAPVIIKTMMEATGLVEGYSFWTFTDIFEENYFPSMPFHGGFGLLNLQGIAKPAYRAFELLHQLGTEQLLVDGLHETVNAWGIRRPGAVIALLTNHALPRHPIDAEHVNFQIRGALPVCTVCVERIDEDHANPKRLWDEMGEPEYLSARDVQRLNDASRLAKEPLPWNYEDGTIQLKLALPPHGVAAVTVDIRARVGQRGGGMNHTERSLVTLDELQRQTFDYFVHEVNPVNGLIADRTQADAPASIAAVGLALAAYPAGVERALITRAEAAERTLATLRFFWNSPQGPQVDATGYKGFYYHFLDMTSGRRVWKCELSTIDSTFLLAGMLAAAAYFDHDSADEHEIRTLADNLYRRVDWRWAQDGGATVTHGWKPESGFLPYRWQGYDEALLLYLLGLGSPTHPLPAESYLAWTSTYQWRKVYDHEFLYAGPLFIHQLSHVWVDFRGIQDEYMRGKSIDYFENSRRATYVQQQYAIHNPCQFDAYGENCWGITASNGPGWVTRNINGKERHFFDYLARGVPDGPDDGTIAPWAVVASLPFAPEIVLPALQYFDDLNLRVANTYGYKATFNPTFPRESADAPSWVSPWHLGLNQGPIVLMIENYRSGLLWRLMRQCSYLVSGLRRAGFSGGWLGTHGSTDSIIDTTPAKAGKH